MARPATESAKIDKDELEKLMKLYPSEIECADWFGVTIKTLQRFIRTHFDASFVQLRDKSFVRTKVAIKRAQIDKALKGDNTMLIWVGKQYLSQAEKIDQNTKNEHIVETRPRTIEEAQADLAELEMLRAKQGK